MPRIAVRLTAAEVKTLPARTSPYWDGDGLGLRVRGAERAFWIYRYQIDREKRELGLGRARGPNAITLAAAPAKHATLRAMVESGTHPPKAQEKKRAAAAAEAEAQAAGITFRGVADHYLKAHEASWGNPKHRKQWRTTLETYVMVGLGPMPVSAVGTGEIMSILEPIWSMRPQSASRVRGRIEAVLDYAAARGWRTGENPARWRGHVQKLLPARNKGRTVRHFAALPWQEAGAFMARLREQDGMPPARPSSDLDGRPIGRGSWGAVGRNLPQRARVARPGGQDESGRPARHSSIGAGTRSPAAHDRGANGTRFPDLPALWRRSRRSAHLAGRQGGGSRSEGDPARVARALQNLGDGAHWISPRGD